MDFTLSAEQAQFRDSVRRLVDAPSELPREGFNMDSYASAWRDFATLGATGLCIDETRGGFSGAGEDIALVAIELGRAPVTTPRFDTMVMAGRILGAAPTATAEDLCDRFVAGDLQTAVAAFEGDDPLGVDRLATVAVRTATGYCLTGNKAVVIGGGTADCLLVTSVMPSGELGVFSVDPATPGIERSDYRLVDTTPVIDIIFRSISIAETALLAQGAEALRIVQESIDLAIIAQCAAEVGGMARAIDLCISHMNTRQQFGRPLADFQTLQHRVADMFIVANNARSSVYAAVAATHGPANTRSLAASRCKVAVSHASKVVIGDAVHVHGGLGITTEYAVGHLYRRALVDEQLFGNSQYHLDAILDDSAHAASMAERADEHLAA